jgi:NUDIX domain.
MTDADKTGSVTDFRERPHYTEDNVVTLYDARYVRLYDLQYREGAHYCDASRRTKEELVALKSDGEFRSMLPDAVTIAVVVILPGEEPKLLLNYEYRYPIGQYLLSPIAGLIDSADRDGDNPLVTAAIREIHEECGLVVKPTDKVTVLNPCALSSPGMTDESNAFLCAEIKVEDASKVSQDGAEGTELFAGFELADIAEATRLFETGRDRYGNFFSLATWAVLGYFLREYR